MRLIYGHELFYIFYEIFLIRQLIHRKCKTVLRKCLTESGMRLIRISDMVESLRFSSRANIYGRNVNRKLFCLSRSEIAL